VIGSFAFEQGPQETITTAGGASVIVDTMTIGASGVYAFVGLGGPYWAINQDSSPGALGERRRRGGGAGVEQRQLRMGFFNPDAPPICWPATPRAISSPPTLR